VIKVRVEVLPFRHILAKRRLIVIPCQKIVNIVNATWSHSDFTQICRPCTPIGILGLILTEIRRVYSIVDKSVTVVPLLVVVLFEVVVAWVDAEHRHHCS
jgi:hypothetical protein